MTYFLLRDSSNILPKKELHWSPWAYGRVPTTAGGPDGARRALFAEPEAPMLSVVPWGSRSVGMWPFGAAVLGGPLLGCPEARSLNTEGSTTKFRPLLIVTCHGT